MIETDPQVARTNRNALISIIAAVLTILALCAGVVPIPMTGFLCFPTAAVMSAVAVVSGVLSLRQIHSGGGRGSRLALAGATIGGAAALGLGCTIILGIMLLPRLAVFIRDLSR